MMPPWKSDYNEWIISGDDLKRTFLPKIISQTVRAAFNRTFQGLHDVQP
jgi:hypothetical protein